jgi:predicted PurR-regulated permease PerM
MRRVKEPRAILAVLVFAVVFMVGFGIGYAPLLEFATNAVPELSSNITQATNAVPELSSNITQASALASGGV